MKVKFLVKDGDFLKGGVYDLSAPEARKFVESHKIAEYVYHSKSEERRVTTQRKSSRKRKPKPVVVDEVQSEENDESEE